LTAVRPKNQLVPQRSFANPLIIDVFGCHRNAQLGLVIYGFFKNLVEEELSFTMLLNRKKV